MTRAAIYTRFSTDLQNERSIEDQRALCEAFAAREGMTVVGAWEDRARSGGSLFGREGLMDLMEAAKTHAFDVLIIEALDRLSRDMEDLAGLHKRLTFLGIEIRAIHEGAVNTVLVGLRGLVGQLYREDNAHKVRRGMAGRIRAGLAGGGRAYGYDIVPGEKGRRVINEAEAAIVRRIFAEFLDGRSPRQIAYSLNADKVTPPRGAKWNASTLNGNAVRGNGILRNEIYAGRLVWNKIRMLKNPDTGRRISRANPQSEWQATEVPELALVTRADFDAVQTMKRDMEHVKPGMQCRPKHMLSGLLRCGACGSGMSATGADKSGMIRVRCSAWMESRSCTGPRSFYLPRVEAAVIDALRDELATPKATAEFVRTYHEERKRLAERDNAERAETGRRIDRLTREIARLVDGIAKGIGDPATLGAAMLPLTAEKAELERQIANMGEPVNVVALHPTILARYSELLSDLSHGLKNADATGDPEARGALRELVEKVTIHPDDTRRGGFMIEVSGRMAAILGEEAFPNRLRRQGYGQSGIAMVAEVRYSRYPTFKLYAFG